MFPEIFQAQRGFRAVRAARSVFIFRNEVSFYIRNEESSIGNEDSSMILMIENEDSSVENDDFNTDPDQRAGQ